MEKHILSIITAIFLIFMNASICISEQNEDGEDGKGLTLGNWKLSGNFQAAGSYMGYKDWQSGGVETGALNFLLDFSAKYVVNKSEWRTSLKTEYGFTKIKSEDLHKAVDEFSLKSGYYYHWKKHIGCYGKIKASTMMTSSHLHYEDPIHAVFSDCRKTEEDAIKVRIANAWEPLNLSESAGSLMTVFKNEEDTRHLDFNVGISARQMVASAYYIEDDEDETEEIEFKKIDGYSDSGAEVGYDLKLNLTRNTLLTSTADIFYGIEDEFWKVDWETTLAMGIGPYFGVSLSVLMVYDEMIFDDPQWKTTSMLTFNYRFF